MVIEEPRTNLVVKVLAVRAEPVVPEALVELAEPAVRVGLVGLAA